MRNLLAILGAILLFALIGAGSYYGGIFGNKVQANYQKRVVTYQVQQKVRTADFAQAAYEHFFNLCGSVQDSEASLDALYAQLATAAAADKSQIETNITANIANRAQSINEYNNDSVEYTRGQFLDKNLPAKLDNSTYTKGTHTTCAA